MNNMDTFPPTSGSKTFKTTHIELLLALP